MKCIVIDGKIYRHGSIIIHNGKSFILVCFNNKWYLRPIKDDRGVRI